MVLLPDEPKYTVVAANQAYAQAMQAQPDEIVGRGLFEVFPDSGLRESLRRVLETRTTDSMPARPVPPRNGVAEERHWRFVNAPVIGPDGAIDCIVHCVQDVTERVRMEQDLRVRTARMEAEQFLRNHDLEQMKRLLKERQLLSSLVEYSPECIGVADLDGWPVYANGAALTMVGVTNLEEARTTPVTEYFVPEERGFVRDVVLPAVRDQGRWQGELHFQHRHSGERIPVLYHAFRVDDAATGKPTHLATITRDLREVKRSERRDAFLVRLDDATRALTDPGEITQTAARLLGEYLQVNRCAYAEVQKDENTVDVTGDYVQGVESIVGRYSFSQFSAEFARAMRAGEPYVVRDTESDPGRLPEAFRQMHIRAAICIPLMKGGRVAAGLAVHQSTPRDWRQDEVELVRAVAGRCWESIERARITRELQESEHHLRVALDTARLGSWELDLATLGLKASPNCHANFGLPPDHEFTYEDLLAMIHPEDRGPMQAAVQRAMREGVDYEAEYRIERPDGRTGWIVANGRVLRLPDGTPHRMVGVTLDVTERKLADQAVRSSEERFRQMANSMPQIVWTARPDGYLDYYNERWYEFTGFDRSLGGDQSWAPLLHPDDRQLCYDIWYGSVRSGEPYQIEYRFWDRREKRWRWFMGRALPARDAAGEIVKWFGTCTDIDEQKRTQQAVLQTQKLESIGLLAGGVAHDFNNLLVGIMGGASFALGTLPPAHPAYAMLQGVVDASERAAHLTRQMLAYAGKGSFIIEPVDLSDMVVRTSQLVSASIPKSVQLQLQIEERIPTVQTDPGQMQQVVMNLILNGAEAVGENRNGMVVIRTRAERIGQGKTRRDVAGHAIAPGLYTVLEVQDTGGGIDNVTLTKIFDPFFTTKFTGRGLGLAAVQGIVRSHKGAIEVDTALGRGSTFRVLLPAERAGAAIEPPRKIIDRPSRGSETVLVVDDEALVRNLSKAALEKAGYDVIVAGAGVDGLERMRDHPEIALVLLDMSMPEMSGRQVLEALQAINPATPVVICSGYSADEVYRQFAGLEMAGVLQKPFTASALVTQVRTILDKVRPRHSRRSGRRLAQNQRVESDHLLDVAAQQHLQFVHLLHHAGDPIGGDARGQRGEFAAQVGVANFRGAAREQQQIAQQLIKQAQIDIELLVLTPADGLGIRQPGAEGADAGGYLEQHVHGLAALFEHRQVQPQRQARAAGRERDAALRVGQMAGRGERAHVVVGQRREAQNQRAGADGG